MQRLKNNRFFTKESKVREKRKINKRSQAGLAVVLLALVALVALVVAADFGINNSVENTDNGSEFGISDTSIAEVERFSGTGEFRSSATAITECQNWSSAEGSSSGVYTLSNDVYYNATCLNVTVNDVEIDCQGFIVNYSATGTVGYGIWSNATNTTIKNCQIIEGSATTANKYGIFFRGASAKDGTIVNNTIDTSGTSGIGVYLFTSANNNNITGNTISTKGASAYGINPSTSSNYNIMDNNTITTEGANGYGIYLYGSYNNATNNTINTSASATPGIYIYKSSYNNMFSNKINTSSMGFWIYGSSDAQFSNIIANDNYVDGKPVNSTYDVDNVICDGYDLTQYGQVIFQNSRNITINNCNISSNGIIFGNSNGTISNSNITSNHGYGISFIYSSNSNISSNKITTGGVYGYGIYFFLSPSDNIIDSNTISTSDAGGVGFYLYLTSNNNKISNNIISTSGASSSHGLYLYLSSGNNMTNNTISTIGGNGYGINILSSSSNIITNAVINISHGTTAYGLSLLTASTNNTFSGINLTSNRYAIFVDGTSHNFTMSDSVLKSFSSYDIGFDTETSGSVNFTNVSFVNKTFHTASKATLNTHWYLDAYANYTNGTNAVGANITGWNVTGATGFYFSQLTNDSGNIPRQTLLEYSMNTTGIIKYFNNYTINATRVDGAENLTQSVNMSTNRDITFSFDALPPVIIIDSPLNATYNSSTIYFNVSTNENTSWCGFSLDNLVNVSMQRYNESYFNFTNTTISDGSHNVSFSCNDTLNNINTTSLRWFGVDTTPPFINITFPLNISYNTNVSELNYSVSDTNLQNCTYSLNLGVNNVTITCGSNVTTLTSVEGNNTWIVWANDSVGNTNFSNVTFYKDTISPNATLTFPNNSAYINNSDVNFTANLSDISGLKNATLFVYNDTGLVNQTDVVFVGIITDKLLGIVVGLVDGIYTWWYKVWDLIGNTFSTGNYTALVDSSYPQFAFNSPTPANGSGVAGEFMINLSLTETNLANITYTINMSTYTANYTYGGNYSLSSPVNLTTGLVLMMNFDNESAYGENETRAFDFSGNGNNGTMYGGVVVNTSGKYNGAMTFDGQDNFINVTINITQVNTTLFWYKNTTSGWIHIANISGVANYVNGEIGTPIQYPIYFVENSSQIGKTGGLDFFNGSIDEVTIWNRSLSDGEISQLYLSKLRKYYDTGRTYIQYYPNGTNNVTMTLESSNMRNWSLLINQSGISGGGAYKYNISATDMALNYNITETRTVLGNVAPVFGLMNYTPNTSAVLDPGVVLTIRANITDTDNNFETAIFQWKNYTAEWGNATNVSMNNLSETSIQTIFNSSFSPIYESNYSYRIWTNDTQNSVTISNITNISIFWDCTWVLDTQDFSATSGYSENKFIGNISINNTGDINYVNNNCTLDFKLYYDLPEGRVYFDVDYGNPTYSNSLAAGVNRTISTNATFLTALNEEALVIEVREWRSRSETYSRDISASLVTSPGGPYLYEKIVSTPAAIYLTPNDLTLSAYLRNVAGNDTDSNTAFNVSFNWSLPSNWLMGNTNLSYHNLSDNSFNYYNLNVSFNSSNLASLSPGSFTLYLYAWGYNSSGSPINHSGGRTLLTEQTNITLSCYNISDDILVTACGSLDGDYEAPATTTTTTVTSGGGGGGAAAAAYAKSEATFELVRGGKQEFELEIKNRYPEEMQDVKVTVTGINSEFIEIIPKKISKINPSSSIKIKIKINAPSYFVESEYRLVFYIDGYVVSGYNRNPFTEKKIITLQILEVDRTESSKNMEESREMLDELKELNFTTKEIEKLLAEIEEAYNSTDFSVVKKNYERIKLLYENAKLSDKLMKELNENIRDAERYGISINEAKRLVNLAESAFLRGDYETSIARLREAQLAYALETKGEFNLAYYVRRKPIESGGIALLAGVTLVSSSLLIRRRLLKAKIKILDEEEKLLIGLMKVVQKECFEEGKISMDEYGNAMMQYETRLNIVIQDKITTETKLLHLFVLRGKEEKSLKAEAKRLKDLMKETQKQYFGGSKIETRIYENMLKSYSQRLSEVEEKLATLDAQKTLKARGLKL